MPKISFLIATKNRAYIIKDTIKSLVGQTFKDWEAIIVDDHSTDSTLKIFTSHHDQRLRYYKLSDGHGHGASCARNFAAVYARADIVAMLDSDDIAYPRRAEKIVETFKNQPSLDVFYSDIDIYDESKATLRDRKTPIYPYSYERMKKLHYIPHSTVAMRRQILLDNPYNQFFRFAEDYELLSRLAQQKKNFFYCDEKLTKYRISQDNITRQPGSEELLKQYGLLVKMVRGWIPFSIKILNIIDDLENKRK